MATTKFFLAVLLFACALPTCRSQSLRNEPKQEAQPEEQRTAQRAWAPPGGDKASVKADSFTEAGIHPFSATSTHAKPAIAEVQQAFKVYPDVVGELPLPTNGDWKVPETPGLAFLPACKASKASCLEVQYSVTSRNVLCLWTVLFPAPVEVKGKQVQTLAVINENADAAKYTMLVNLQTGMNYATVRSQAPVYPAGARAKDWTGAVSLDIVVSPAGKVVSIPDVRGPALLKPSAKQAVAKWVYAPTQLGSQKVARSFTVQVNYSVGPPVK